MKTMAIIDDNGHKYICESMDKARVLSFIDWFLDNVSGTTEIQILFRQNDGTIKPPVPPVMS
jgi:hypothetical protein